MIVDANPIVTACLGTSRPLFRGLIATGENLFVPEQQMREARLVTFREGQARGMIRKRCSVGPSGPCRSFR